MRLSEVFKETVEKIIAGQIEPNSLEDLALDCEFLINEIRSNKINKIATSKVPIEPDEYTLSLFSHLIERLYSGNIVPNPKYKLRQINLTFEYEDEYCVDSKEGKRLLSIAEEICKSL